MQYSSYEEQGDHTPPVLRYSSNEQGDIGERSTPLFDTQEATTRKAIQGEQHITAHTPPRDTSNPPRDSNKLKLEKDLIAATTGALPLSNSSYYLLIALKGLL